MVVSRSWADGISPRPAQRQDGLGLAVAGLLGRAAGRIALDDEQFGAVRAAAGAIGELAGQAQLAGRRLALGLAVLAATQPLLGALDHPVEQVAGLLGMARQEMVEMILDRGLDQA